MLLNVCKRTQPKSEISEVICLRHCIIRIQHKTIITEQRLIMTSTDSLKIIDFHVTKYVALKQVKMRQLKFSNDVGLISVFEQKQSQIIKNWWEI